MVKRIKAYPKPERPLKVAIAGGGEAYAACIALRDAAVTAFLPM